MSRHPSQESMHSIGADAGTLVVAVGGVTAINEGIKAYNSDHDANKHLLHAGIGAAIAGGGYEMLRRSLDEEEETCPRHVRRHRSASTCSDAEYEARRHSHHKLHVAEEVAGAWAVVKGMLGDKDHPKVHFLEEVLGALGLYQEMKERQNGHKTERHHE